MVLILIHWNNQQFITAVSLIDNAMNYCFGLTPWIGYLLSQVKKQDQLVPFMVLDIASDLPGLPGLFMAGVISGSLR